MSKIFVFPDTNIFLHFRNLDEIDFPSLLGHEKVEIVIAYKVIEELDRIKWEHPTEGTRNRAGKNTQKIAEWLSTEKEIRANVNISRYRRPNPKVLRKYSLYEQSADDCILASMIEYKSRKKEKNVSLLTNDTGPTLRAEEFGLDAFGLPDEYKLEPPRDSLRKELLETRKRLVAIEGRAPKLSLQFSGYYTELSYNIQAEVPYDEDTFKDDLERVMASIQPEPLDTLPTDKALSINLEKPYARTVAQTFQNIPQSELERFEREKKEYPTLYELYYKNNLEIQNEYKRTLLIDLMLQNAGTAVAEDFHVDVRLPDKLFWRIDNLVMDSQPPLPHPPKRMHELIQAQSSFTGVRYNQIAGTQSGGGPTRSNTRPYKNSETHLTWSFPSLLHNSIWNFDRVFAVFKSFDDISNFTIDYSIRERNTPELVTGKLLIKMQPKEEDNTEI